MIAKVAFGLALSVSAASAADPIISVGLSAGSNPNASLSSEIATLQAREHSAEAEGLNKISAAMQAALSNAKAEIASVVGGKSFMRNSVLVKVLSGPGISHANLQRIADLEGVRGGYESGEIAQAASEFDAINKVVIGELRSALHGGASFLKSDVLVKAGSTPFPTIMGMLKQMEYGRDSSESKVRSKILDLELAYAKQLNSVIASAMSHSFLGDVANFARNPAPYDVINIALEDSTNDAIELRKDAEESRFEARAAADIAAARAQSGSALAKLTALEKAHAAAMSDIL